MVLSAEIRWLLACVRSLPGQEAPSPPDLLSWDRVLAIAEAEGLAPALASAVKTKAPTAVPAAVRERLHRRLADGIAGQLILGRELGRLLRLFEREGVPVIPLKGPALAETLYPHPALRPCSDLDLLVRRDSVPRVDDLLHGLGYCRWADAHSFRFDLAYDRATLYEGPSGVRVDLHWGLLSEPRYAWDEREGLTVWDRAVRIRVAGVEALGLCPEDLLLYLAVHLAVHHALAGVLWYYDLYLVIERWASTLDWEALIARASRWRVRTAFYFALLGLEMLFGARAPAGVMVGIEPRGPRAALMSWLLRHRTEQQRRRLEHLIALLLVDRGRDLLGTLRHALLPPPAWLEARYEGLGSSRLGYYWAHYRRLGQILHQATGGLGASRGRDARDRTLVATAALAGALGGPASRAAELVHGADSAFAGHGVVVLWGVLRGADEATMAVVLRVVRVDPALGALAVDGIDPFTGRGAAAAPPAALQAMREVRIPRAWFGEYPRTEIHLARSPEDLAARRPLVTIYFTGVPDTTPEFATEAALAAYLERALARARGR